MKATSAINWLTNSGMKVNAQKTELCVFSTKNQQLVEVEVQGEKIKSSKTNNVLGVVFDSKINCSNIINK